MNLKDIENLRKEVFKAFPKDSPPNSFNVTDHHDCCEDGKDLQKDFSEKQWWDIDSTLIESNHGNIPLFTGDAYLYYFPAFLLNSLNFSNYNIVLQFLIYELSGFDGIKNNSNNYHHKRLQLFSENQVKLIVNFLEFIYTTKRESTIDYISEVKKALDFWRTHLKSPMRNNHKDLKEL